MKSVQPERTANAALPGGGPDQLLLLRLEMKSDPKLLCAVRGAVERLTESFGFSSEECRAVTRAVDEALTNIIRHAYCGRLDQPIEVLFHSVQRQSGNQVARGLEILLCDRGPAIDESKLCGRQLDDVKPGGLGLHFIQESMDIVEFKHADGTNRLRLVKYLSAPKQGANA